MPRQKPNPIEVERVLKSISRADVEQINRDNPFRNERNAAIKRLCRRGIKRVILSHISGLCDQTISRICRQKRKKRKLSA